MTFRSFFRKVCKKAFRIILGKKFYDLGKEFYDKFTSPHYWRKTPRDSLRFQVHIVEHCNLNCAYCLHFSPLAEKEFIDILQYEKDCERIKELTKNNPVESILLLGGEPLVHPDIEKIFSITRTYFDARTAVILITNGILLPKMEDTFWHACKINNIYISITKYPIKLDIEKIHKKAAEYCVKTARLNYTMDILTINQNIFESDNCREFWKVPLDINGKQNIKNTFRQCTWGNDCIMLANGKLYTCHLMPNIRHFNAFFEKDTAKKFKVSEKDSIDIYKAKNISEILDFLSRPVPFCRYCTLQRIDVNWQISNKKITEWLPE
jgi:sulfatase maturation enzyme AslB (radical SAM superfamily)